MDNNSDNEMPENITITDDTHKDSDVYNELLEVISQFDNSPLGETGPIGNAESDNSQTGQSGPIGDAVCDESPVVQPGLIGNTECDKSPIGQPSPSTFAEPEASQHIANKKGKVL